MRIMGFKDVIGKTIEEVDIVNPEYDGIGLCFTDGTKAYFTDATGLGCFKVFFLDKNGEVGGVEVQLRNNPDLVDT